MMFLVIHVTVSRVGALVLSTEALVHAVALLVPPGRLGSPPCARRSEQGGLSGTFISLGTQKPFILTHHNYCTPGPPSPSWGKLCCTWSSLLLSRGPQQELGSTSSSSHLHTRSCRGSPDRQEEASTGSSPPLWRWSWCWISEGRSR